MILLAAPHTRDALGRTVQVLVIDGEAASREPAVLADVYRLLRVGGDVVAVAAHGIDHVPTGLRHRHTWQRGRLLVLDEEHGDLYEAVPQGLERRAPSGDAAGALHRALDARGLGGSLVATVEPGRLRAVLGEQIDRRTHRRVPGVDHAPGWSLVEPGPDPLRQRAQESLLTLAAGGTATRGAVEELREGAEPLVLCSGVYTGSGAEQELLAGPLWTVLDVHAPLVTERRALDLRTGVLERVAADEQGRTVRTVRFAGITRPGLHAMRAEGPPELLAAGPVLHPPLRRQSGVPSSTGTLDGPARHWWAETGTPGGPRIAAVATQHVERDAEVRTVERLAVYTARPGPDLARARVRLARAGELGFEALLDEQRAAWTRRWDEVDVTIPDDPDAELSVRYALFQLWNIAGRHDELAVGARGLSGEGYRGHVFWDADAFVLPALLAVDPRAAAAMVRYRIRRLGAARRRARSEGRAGARYPWESAADGDDVTPVAGDLGGQQVPILTGAQEEHITADVAWAAVGLADWTGRHVHRRPGCLMLLVDTARYWASRVREDGDGALHIDHVIGPDEYHEGVDDNAFTNGMAGWNLRTAASALDALGRGTDEARHWREQADRLVDGYDPATGRHEQFRGYFELEPLTVDEVAPPPVAADLLLGRERVARSQLIKQPDVLMLHRLVAEDMPAGSLTADLDFYGPRTAHGSSLSPAVMAELLARAGRSDEAVTLFDVARRLDLDDNGQLTAMGLHLADVGGVVTAVLAGFAGIAIRAGGLSIDPHLPSRWSRLHVRFRCLGRRLRVEIGTDAVTVTTDGPTTVRVAGGVPTLVSGTRRLPLTGEYAGGL